MTVTFQDHQKTTPGRTGLKLQAVYDLLAAYPHVALTCKTIGRQLGIDITVEEHLKDISNRCSYLVSRGLAERVDKGTYRAITTGLTPQEGNGMTVTDTPNTANNLAEAALPEQTAFPCPECKFTGRSQMGLRAHMTRTHKNRLSHDEAFDRVAQATKILFPDPNDVYDRLEEIAQLRKEMFKAVTR